VTKPRYPRRGAGCSEECGRPVDTVSRMNAPLHLPSEAATLAGFADDLVDFTVEGIAHRIGEPAVAALDREDPLPAELATAGEEDPLALLIHLFLLGGQLTDAQLQAALPKSAAEARTWGLVAGAGTGSVRAGVDLRPTTIGTEDVWLAADLSEIATGRPLPADHVLGLGGASATLVDLTVRTRADRALDLGTGSGIQTLGLATQAEHVLATDISPRALEFAAFNVALNDAMAHALRRSAPGDRAGQIEFRQGSFFEPVDGDYDLIVSNPPFVVSPRTASLERYTYRDGGFVGDGVVQHLLEEMPDFLRPGGVAQLLANWEVHEGQEWHARIGEWVRALGIDAWVVQREFLDPAHYVATWIRDGGLTPDRDPEGYRSAYTDWLADFDSRGVQGIGFGYITLRKPARPRPPWVRLEEITGTIGAGLGETIARTLQVVESLAGARDDDLLQWHLEVAPDVTEERYYRPGASDPNVILLRQGGGFARSVQIDTLGAAVVGACDGELSLGQICAAVACLISAEEGAVMADVLPTIRGLLTDGLLVHRPT